VSRVRRPAGRSELGGPYEPGRAAPGVFAGSALASASEPTPIPWTMHRPMAIFDVPQRFSQKWVHDKVPTMDGLRFRIRLLNLEHDTIGTRVYGAPG
jgi:hypothetical protein